MNMEAYYCLAYLNDSVLPKNSMCAPVSVIRFALGGFLHGVFNQWEIINALKALIGYLWVSTFSD